MKNPKVYIIEQLESLNKPSNISGPATPSQDALIEFIGKTVLSKKFRKYSLPPEYLEHILSAIDINVKNNKPIQFAYPFGANKLWRLDEAPEVDWAELFSLIYFAKWLKPITEYYKFGTHFEFCSDDIVIETLNNLPKSETEAYIKSFKELLAFIKPFLPENFTFSFSRVGDRYTEKKFFDELNEKKEKLLKESGGSLPQLTESQKRSIELNVKLKPGQNDDPLWMEKNQLLHNAYLIMSEKRPYYQTSEKITAFSNPINKALP